jgi:hypothetical protein
MRRGQILTAAFELYRKSFLPFVAMAGAVSVPLALAQYYLIDRLTLFQPVEVEPGEELVIDERFWKYLAGVIALGFISSLLTTILTGALTRGALVAVAEERPNAAASFGFALRRFGSILWIGLLTALFTLAGFLAFIVPGIIIVVRTLLAMPTFVLEGIRGRAALRRSWRLVKGEGWMVFGMWILAAIAAGIVGGLLSAPFGEGWIAPGLANGVALALTIPFTTCVVVYLYLDLRARREGLDRDGLVAELAGQRALPPPPALPFVPPGPLPATPAGMPPPAGMPTLPPPPGELPPPPS